MILAGASLFVLFLALVMGQLLRFPLPGQGGGLLLSDIATVLVLLAAALYTLSHQRARNQKSESRNQLYVPISIFLFLFMLWSLFTLVIRMPELGLPSAGIAALYWLRLAATLTLFPALLFLFQKKSLRVFIQKTLFLTIATLIALGLAQLIFLPDLNGPALGSLGEGWDPHRGRLVSTWLDPNLFGGFLVVTIPWLVTRKQKSETRNQIYFLFSIFFFLSALIALLLTQSRSSFVALAGAALVLAPFIIWQLHALSLQVRRGLVASLLLASVIFLLAAVLLLPERFRGLLTIDETATLRLASLASAWQIIQDHPWLGVGYNAYQFATPGSDFTIHSRAGADNSVLTLWATTGLLGLAAATVGLLAILGTLLRRATQGDTQALGAAGSIVALIIHSQFVNSFLYSHLLITLIVVIALCLSTPPSSLVSPSSSRRI